MTSNPLPMAWIDRIFSHMGAMYGSKFADLWRDTDQIAVKALWAEKLGGFIDHPKAIKAALDSLDDKPWPPTLPEFLMLCRQAAHRDGQKVPALEHKLSPEEIERNRERLEKIKADLAKRMVEP